MKTKKCALFLPALFSICPVGVSARPLATGNVWGFGYTACHRSGVPHSAPDFHEGRHGEERQLPYMGYGRKQLTGGLLTNRMSRAQGDSTLRADMKKLCRMFRRFGRDSVLPACPAHQVGACRWLLGNRKHPQSRLMRKLEHGDRDIHKEYVSFRKWEGGGIPGIERRGRIEFALSFEP